MNSIYHVAIACSFISITAWAQSTTLGTISGSLGYPSNAIPPLRVCAIAVSAPSASRCTRTKENQAFYRIPGLRPGSYHVVAYVLPGTWGDPSLAGGYTQMVICGLKRGCDDHTLIPVEVKAGRLARGINPDDWYASRESFPEEPK